MFYLVGISSIKAEIYYLGSNSIDNDALIIEILGLNRGKKYMPFSYII